MNETSIPLLLPLMQLAAGLVVLLWGAERLVTGAASLARGFGISPLVVGMTIIGFGTSAPELVISVAAAWRGNPALAAGNAIGSNLANIGLVLAIATLLRPITIDSSILRREAPVLLAVTVLAAAMLADFDLTRPEGIVLGALLLVFLTWAARLGRTRQMRTDPLGRELQHELPAARSQRWAILWILVGLAALPISSVVMVEGAVASARLLDVPEEFIGLTLVAIGTSLPELAAALASSLKKEGGLTLGNIIGSNLFNLLGVLGIAASIRPLTVVAAFFYRDVMMMVALTVLMTLLYFWPGRRRVLNQGGGILLLVSYLFYLSLLLGALGAER